MLFIAPYEKARGWRIQLWQLVAQRAADSLLCFVCTQPMAVADCGCHGCGMVVHWHCIVGDVCVACERTD